MTLLVESSDESLCVCAENGCMYSFCGGDVSVIQMMFDVNVVNTKDVDNFLILFFLKFHDFRHDGLGVIDFTSLLSAFARALNRSE